MSQVRNEPKERVRRAASGSTRKELSKAARTFAVKEQLRKSNYEQGQALLSPEAGKQPESTGGRPERPLSFLRNRIAGSGSSISNDSKGVDTELDPKLDPKQQPKAKTEYADPKYGKVEGTPFVREADDTNAIAMDDVSQGRLGDCYFVASLAAIADKNPEVIRKMIQDDGNGTYTVTFHEGGKVVVDNQFPVSGGDQPAYADVGDVDASSGKELWVMLIEKAWAKLKGGYEQIRGSKVDMKSTDAMEAISGNKTTRFRTSGKSDQELLKALNQASEKGLPMTAGTHPKKHFDEEKLKEMKRKGVYANHAYAVVSVDFKKGTVELYNPWGKEQTRPVLDMATFREYYREVNINSK